MRIARIYSGDAGRSHFEDLDIPLNPVSYGEQSPLLPSEGVILRQTPQGSEQDFHPAPRRQLVITLSGQAEIECGDGSKRRFGPGDVMLADDTTGQGHITRVTEGPRRFLFVPIPDSVDVSQWRT